MDAMVHSLVENAVANYLTAVVGRGHVRQLKTGADFEVEKDGQKFIVEVKSKKPDDRVFKSFLSGLARLDTDGAKIALVTTGQGQPTQVERDRFESMGRSLGYDAHWIELSELADFLGTESLGDLTSPEVMSKVQTRSLINGLERYSNAPIGNLSPGNNHQQLNYLARQFSHESLAGIYAQPGEIEERLRLGTRVPEVTVVLTDIVNFSSLVSVSRPEELRTAMEKYYRLARHAVFNNGGMLDKFIGDAVLAVFGYPYSTSKDATNAISFGREMIALGEEVFQSWLEELNAKIPTGTRVGVATGDIWPINIGIDHLEVSLLGDTINFAARLEQNAHHDKILIDNRSKTKALRENSNALHHYSIDDVVLGRQEAKGQMFETQCWQLTRMGTPTAPDGRAV